MTALSLLAVVAAMGLRHGVDPDHLTAIDGLARFHPSRWNGVLFALGHGVLVTLLAVGCGSLLAKVLEPYSAWILVFLGAANLYRLVRPASAHQHGRRLPHIVQASPLLLGVLFGMGFETASQLSALLLAGQLNPWLLGTAFTLGMMLVDGVDGALAARTQAMAQRRDERAVRSSQLLGVLVTVSSFFLAAMEFTDRSLDHATLPLGFLLIAVIVALRCWSGGLFDSGSLTHRLAQSSSSHGPKA